MNKERVLKAIEYVKGSPETMDYGKWGALNIEQRRFIRELCNSWLILDEATNMQTKEIERLNNKIQDLQADYGNKAQVERDLLEQENHRLNNIIKEVREYIEERGQFFDKVGDYVVPHFDKDNVKELRDILRSDKE